MGAPAWSSLGYGKRCSTVVPHFYMGRIYRHIASFQCIHQSRGCNAWVYQHYGLDKHRQSASLHLPHVKADSIEPIGSLWTKSWPWLLATPSSYEFFSGQRLEAYVSQIYRCWIVYERRWLVITPSLFLYLGSIAMAIKILETECNPATIQSITLNSSQIRPWYATFFGINAVQNFLTTGESKTPEWCNSSTISFQEYWYGVSGA